MIDDYEGRMKAERYWENQAEFFYTDLEAKWRVEGSAAFGMHSAEVYADRGSLLNYVSNNRSDWNSYMRTPRFGSATVDDLTDGLSAAVSAWITSLATATPNLVLVGSNGQGKTHAAFAACRFLSLHGVVRGNDTLYMPMSRILRCENAHNLLDNWSKEQDSISNVDIFKTAPLLLLDDLGAVATTSQSAISNIISIMSYRYENQLPTVVTTNPDEDELCQMYGTTSIRRLFAPPSVVKR